MNDLEIEPGDIYAVALRVKRLEEKRKSIKDNKQISTLDLFHRVFQKSILKTHKRV